MAAVSVAVTLLMAGALASVQAVASLSEIDRAFLAQAGNMGNSQTVLAGLAATKATDPRVREYARRLVADHARIAQRLGDVARAIGTALPHRLDQPATRERARLASLSGRAFDHEFLRFEILDFRFHVAQFTREGAQGATPALRRFAQETLPTVTAHLRAAVSLAATR